MKPSKLLLPVASVCLLLAALPARADPGRAVYVNGKNYKVILSGGYITVSLGGPQDLIYEIFQSPYRVCRTYNKVPGEGLAVFDDKIFYAYTADTPGTATDTTSCSSPGHGMSVWVAVFDVAKRDTAPWISNRALGSVAIKYQTSSASGAAITVFNNQLYLFTDSGIYTSTDGSAWAGPYAALESSAWEPLDAVTIYPALYNQGPRILIVYGLQTSSTYLYYTSLWGATWNGKWGAEQRYSATPSPPFPYGTQQQILGSVSLLPGTASFNGWGAKEAAVQLLMRVKVGSTNVIQHLEYTYGTTLGQWRVDPTTYGTSVTSLLVYPTSQQECTVPSYWDLRQKFFVTYFAGSFKSMEVLSDALTPLKRDIPIVNCGDPGGTETNMTVPDPLDPVVLKVRQNYWTLVGVILGSPPFPQNGYTAFSDYQNFSNVNYGQDRNTGVEQTQSMSNAIMVSAGVEVHAGLENVAGVAVNIDASYKHTWESSNGEAVTKQIKRTDLMGTQNLACWELGKWGWALFMAPTVVYQDWVAYAWDYNPATGTASGSPLNQDLHTIKVKEIATNPEASFTATSAYFELADPGGPNDQYPGLLKGMKKFNSSLNTGFWYNPGFTWQTDPRWDTLLGEGTLPQLQFGGGHTNELSYSESTQSFASTGQTNDITYSEKVSVSAGSKINGMSAYLSTGYAGSFKTNTKTTTGFGTQLTFIEKPRSCNYPGDPKCVSSLTVQPYWLMAKDVVATPEARAPWVPDAFKNQRPWAITWKVWSMDPIGGMDITAPTCPPKTCTTSADCAVVAPATYCNNPTGGYNAGACTNPPAATLLSSSVGAGAGAGGSRAGTALLPVHASGRVVSGMGGGLGGEPSSHYAIQGGRLAWFLNGVEERIPMTADQFDPGKGISVQLQDLSWSLTNANGTWTRAGNVWTFQSNGDDNRMTMTIDFSSARYDLGIQKLDLSGRVPAGTTVVRLVVTVNQQYMFYTDLKHDVDIAWRWSLPAPDANTLHVTSTEGRFNSATQSGKASIAGTLPAKLPAFGDLEVNVNEHPYLAQLVAIEDFRQAVQTGGTFKYAKEGLILSFDFGGKTWSATFNEKAFHELLVPQVGVLRTRVSVGGAPLYRAESSVLDYSASLSLKK